MDISKQFILKELRKVTLFKETNITSGVSIVCPFHKDTDPSCNVSLGFKVPLGIFHCFSCGAKGTWNTLAEKLGMSTVTGEITNHKNLLSFKIEKFKPEDEDTLNLEELDINWKGFSIDFLKQFKAKKLWDEELKDYYVYLPVTYIGSNYGYIRCKLYKDSIGLKYWFGMLKKIFYPFDYYLNKNVSTLVLVEGVTDALRLIKYGIPTLATLGTKFNIKLGLDLLDDLDVETIILCYDGDDPGKDAVFGTSKFKGLADILEAENYKVRVLIPPKDHDPYSMPKSYIKILQNMVKRTGGTLC